VKTMGDLGVRAYWLLTRAESFPSSWLLLLVDCSGFLTVLADEDEALCENNIEETHTSTSYTRRIFACI
jgi:hypothetical protein